MSGLGIARLTISAPRSSRSLSRPLSTKAGPAVTDPRFSTCRTDAGGAFRRCLETRRRLDRTSGQAHFAIINADRGLVGGPLPGEPIEQRGAPHQKDTPMQPENLASAPRCGARTRAGAPCRSPAVGGSERCRMRGGKGSGAPVGNRNRRKHGLRSRRIREIARYLRATRGGALARPPEEAL